MQRIGLAVAGVLALGLVGVVEGQTLRAGQTVRVRLSDGRRFEARLVAVDANPLVLRFGQSPQVVPISSVDSLWLRRNSAGRGAIVGGIVVGASSAVFWTLACLTLGGRGVCLALVPAFTGVTAAVGAGVGALIGSPFHHWKPIHHPVTLSLGVGTSGLKAGGQIRF